jgi:hypothetical protein
VHHVNKGLCISSMEGTNHVTFSVVQENRLKKGGEFIGSKSASNQTSTSLSVSDERICELLELVINRVQWVREYHSRIQ